MVFCSLRQLSNNALCFLSYLHDLKLSASRLIPPIKHRIIRTTANIFNTANNISLTFSVRVFLTHYGFIVITLGIVLATIPLQVLVLSAGVLKKVRATLTEHPLTGYVLRLVRYIERALYVCRLPTCSQYLYLPTLITDLKPIVLFRSYRTDSSSLFYAPVFPLP